MPRSDIYKSSPPYKQAEADKIPDNKNAKYLQHELAVGRLNRDNPLDLADARAVEIRINEYWALCIENEMKPSVTGLCRAIGVDRHTVRDWYNGVSRGPEHHAIIKEAYTTLESLWEDYAQNGQMNPAALIFLGRNHWGYQDQVAVVVKEPEPLGPAPDTAQLAAAYIEALPETHTTYKELPENP